MSDVIAAILSREPNWRVLPEETPAGVRRVLQRCLEKDPKRRLHDIADAGIEIEEAMTAPTAEASPAASRARGRDPLAWTLVAGLWVISLAALALTAVAYFTRASLDIRVYRTSVVPPEGASFASPSPSSLLALSPDGRRLAFIARGPGAGTRLWVRQLDAPSAELLAGTEGAAAPFWSPDSRFIGFFDVSSGKLKKIGAGGGQPVTLADSVGQPGVTWGRDDVIVFARGGAGGPLRRVSAGGGAPSPVTTVATDNGEIAHWLPFFLPDGRHFLYLAVGSKSGGGNAPNGIYVASLDSNERKLLVPGGSNAKYAQGYLFFMRGQRLMAQPFDLDRLEPTSDAVPITEQVAIGGGTGVAGAFSVSETGVLAYQTGGSASRLVRFDRSGKRVSVRGQSSRSAWFARSSTSVLSFFFVVLRTTSPPTASGSS